MAKILTLAPINRPDDGKFEIITFPHNRKLMLIRKLFKAATTGLAKTERRNKYQFTIIKDMPMQLDGEVLKVKKGSRVNVVSVKQVLSTIV